MVESSRWESHGKISGDQSCPTNRRDIQSVQRARVLTWKDKRKEVLIGDIEFSPKHLRVGP